MEKDDVFVQGPRGKGHSLITGIARGEKNRKKNKPEKEVSLEESKRTVKKIIETSVKSR